MRFLPPADPAMQKQPVFDSPDAYVQSITGWQRPRVDALRALALATPGLEERVKWGHLVYLSNGPALLIRAEPTRLLLGFWRGQRLHGFEPRLKAGGKFEMATLAFTAATPLERSVAEQLMRQAVLLNATLGDPTKAAPVR